MSSKEEASIAEEFPQPLDQDFVPTESKRELNDYRSNESIVELHNVNTTLDYLLNITKTNPYHPYNWSTLKKYSVALAYCSLQTTVLMTSTTYLGVEWWIVEEFNVNTQVATLGQSMFIAGTAVSPAFLGPLSDVAGRKWVYVGSMICYALFNIGCALPKNMAMFAIFMFLSGCAAATTASNVAGTIADMFVDSPGASQAMALFVMSANIGPSLGSPIGEWIGENENMGFRWVYYLNVIFGGVWAIILCVLPETLPRVVISNAAKKELNAGAIQEVAIYKPNVLVEMRFATVMAFKILGTEPIIQMLGLYNGFAYGLLFLYLDGVFDVFAINNGLSPINADLTYLNFILGVAIMFVLVPVQTYLYKKWTDKNGGVPKPEYRFVCSLVSVWGFPISLFWFAFTSNGKTSFWSPVFAGVLLGIADPLLWLAMLNYVTDSYPNVAGSAIAAFTIPSFLIAAALSHAGVAMFERMSTTWAVATLGFISLGIVAMVYILWFFGPGLRERSKLAR